MAKMKFDTEQKDEIVVAVRSWWLSLLERLKFSGRGFKSYLGQLSIATSKNPSVALLIYPDKT